MFPNLVQFPVAVLGVLLGTLLVCIEIPARMIGQIGFSFRGVLVIVAHGHILIFRGLV